MLGDDLEPIGLRDRLLLLRTIPELAPLDEEALVLLAEDGRVRRFPRGASLLSPDRPVDRAFLLAEGRVEVQREGAPSGRLRRVVGLLSLLSGEVLGVSAVAEDEVLCVEVPSEAVHRHLVESFPITRNTVRLLAREFAARRGDLPPGDVPLALGRVPEPGRPLTLVEKLLAMRGSPLGKVANLEAAAELVSALRDVSIDAGAGLWALGERSTFWLRIAQGDVACTARDGRSVRLGPGHLLGELDCWGDLPRTFEARAATPVVAQRMDLDEHVAILEAHPETAAALTRSLARRLVRP